MHSFGIEYLALINLIGLGFIIRTQRVQAIAKYQEKLTIVGISWLSLITLLLPFNDFQTFEIAV